MPAYLPPYHNQQFFKADGTVAAGCKLYTYDSGTTTPKAVYTTQAGGTPHTNPITLGSDGRPPSPIWLGSGEYTFALYTDLIGDGGTLVMPAVDDIGSEVSALRADLLDTSVETKNAGMMAFLSSLAYAAGTIGEYLKRIVVSAAGTITQPRFEANNTDDADTPDAAFRVNRTLVSPNSISGHGFRDQTTLQRDAASYAAFDAAVSMDVGGTNDHVAGFQSRPVMAGSGTVNHFYNYASAPIFNAGTVVNNYGGYIYNPSGSGTVTNNYGLYIQNQTKGAALNYALYVAGGSHLNYFGCDTQNLRNFRVGGAAQFITGGLVDSNGYPRQGYNFNPDTQTYQAADVAIVQSYDATGWSLSTAPVGVAGAACTLTPHLKVTLTTGVVRMHAYGAGTATFAADGTLSSVSDERLKIADGGITDAVDKIKALAPGYWRWSEQAQNSRGLGDLRELGFYAQNVQAAIGKEAAPDPVGNAPMGFYDRSVLAVVVVALQEALARIEVLEAAQEAP